MLYWEVRKSQGAACARRRGQAWLSAKPCGCMVAASAIESSPCGVAWGTPSTTASSTIDLFLFMAIFWFDSPAHFRVTQSNLHADQGSRYTACEFEKEEMDIDLRKIAKKTLLPWQKTFNPTRKLRRRKKKPGTVRTVSDPIPPWDDCHRWKQIGCTLGSGHYRGNGADWWCYGNKNWCVGPFAPAYRFRCRLPNGRYFFRCVTNWRTYVPKRTEHKAHVVRKMITCVLADLYRLDNVMPNIGTWKLMLSMTGLCIEAVWEAAHRTRRGPIFIRDGMFCTYLYLLLQTAQVRHTSRESISTCHLSWAC